MVSELQNLQGYRELDERLRSLPLNLQRKVLRGAMRAGGKAMEKVLQRNTPTEHGNLKGTVRSSTDKTPQAITAKAQVGDKKNFEAHFLEWGTGAHLLEPKNDQALKLGADDVFFAHANHPGTKPTHFVSRSMDEGAAEFLQAVKGYIEKRIDKELFKLGGADNER